MSHDLANPNLYLAYGPELHPKVFAERLGGHRPISSRTVSVPTAFLSWDVVGVPWLEPCIASAIVRGVNDQGWSEGDGKPETEPEEGDSDAYKRWIWARTSPQIEYRGGLPPVLEGVAHELSPAAWAHIFATRDGSTTLLPVSCTPYANGDPSIPFPVITAYLPISHSPRAPDLQPTLAYLRLSLLGSFLSVLSREQLAHLFLIRPYEESHRKGIRRLLTLALFPAFLLVHLPLRALERVFGWNPEQGVVRGAIFCAKHEALQNMAPSGFVLLRLEPRRLGAAVASVVGRAGVNTWMAVGWNTYQQLANPTVHWGLTPNDLLRSASTNSSITYPTSRTWANTVHLAPLVAGTTYYYRIDSTNSTTHSFQTARTAGDMTPYTAAVVIDMGVFGPYGLSQRNTTYTGTAVTNALALGEHTTISRLVSDKANYEFVVHPGDFAYADAWLKEDLINYINGTVAEGPQLYEALNEIFWEELSAVSAIKPYMVTAGNHEANCDNGGTKGYTESICVPGQTEFTGFINRFGGLLPASSQTVYNKRDYLDDFPLGSSVLARKAAAARRAVAAGQSLPPFFYSFDYGMAHYVMFDTETDLGNGLIGPDETGGIAGDTESRQGSYQNQQVDWLKADLAAVDRALTPWVIAAGHRPWYVSGGCTVCQTAFEPLLIAGGVDLVLHGHVHNMQRVNPIASNVTDPAGLNNPTAPMYLINGAAGHFEGLDSLGALPSYTAFANDTEYGYSKLTFQDRNHLKIDFVGSNNGNILDSTILYKKH